MKYTIIGAGKTGRGFLGRLLFEQGIQPTFIDASLSLIEALRNHTHYTIEFFGQEREPLHIPLSQVFHTLDKEAKQEIAESDVLFISVGASNLEDVARLIIEANPKKKLLVITAENAIDPSKKIEKVLLCEVKQQDKECSISKFNNFQNMSKAGESKTPSSSIVVTEAAIFCSTIEKPGSTVDILSEAYDRLPFDATRIPIIFSLPSFLIPESNFPLLLTRKIYTYNAASAAIAYLGAYLGYTWYADAANDPKIVKIIDALYEELNTILCTAFNLSKEEQKSFALASKQKFQNINIRDSIERNARDVARKLSTDERLLGPLQLAKQYCISTPSLELVIAAAIWYGLEQQEEKIVTAYLQGIENLLPSLRQEESTLRAIVQYVVQLKEKTIGVL